MCKKITNIILLYSIFYFLSGTNGCAENNGNCSQLCLNRPSGLICACGNNYELNADGNTCTHKPQETTPLPIVTYSQTTVHPKVNSASTCPSNQFTCHTGSIHCILVKFRCDGREDCTDASDEINCPHCPQGHYLCYEKQACLSLEAICDDLLCKEKSEGLEELCAKFDQNLDQYGSAYEKSSFPFITVCLTFVIMFILAVIAFKYKRKDTENKDLNASCHHMVASRSMINPGDKPLAWPLMGSTAPDILICQGSKSTLSLNRKGSDNISLSSFNN